MTSRKIPATQAVVVTRYYQKNSLCHNAWIYFCKKARELETPSYIRLVLSKRKSALCVAIKQFVWLKGLFNISAARLVHGLLVRIVLLLFIRTVLTSKTRAPLVSQDSLEAPRQRSLSNLAAKLHGLTLEIRNHFSVLPLTTAR